jgi:hypothetical protein
MNSRSRLSRSAVLGGGLLLALSCSGVAVAAVQDPVPVGPNQFFSGTVNGQVGTATIQTDCVGPVVSGQVGHPTAGQYVEAILADGSSSQTGYTGDSAQSLAVTLGSATSTASAAVGTIDDYYVPLAIPTTLTVPCGGTGTVTFTPTPSSTSTGTPAQPATVAVTFLPEP